MRSNCRNHIRALLCRFNWHGLALRPAHASTLAASPNRTPIPIAAAAMAPGRLRADWLLLGTGARAQAHNETRVAASADHAFAARHHSAIPILPCSAT